LESVNDSVQASDGLTELEIVHEAMLRVAAFITIANELTQDERWRERVFILRDSAAAPLDIAMAHLRRALDVTSARRQAGARQTTIAT
jgi:hypothetical protein